VRLSRRDPHAEFVVNAQLGLGSEETAEVPSLVRSKVSGPGIWGWTGIIRFLIRTFLERRREQPVLTIVQSLRPYTAVYASAGGHHCVLLAHLTKDANAMDLSA
jgi:hypothetical protein